MNLLEINFEVINKLYEEMRDEALAIVTLAAPKAILQEVRQISMRYSGQGHELNIKIPNESFSEKQVQVLRDLFEAEYERVYGHKLRNAKIEILSWMLTIFENTDSLLPISKSRGSESRGTCIVPEVYEPKNGEFIEAPVYQRESFEMAFLLKGQLSLQRNKQRQ